MFQKNQIFVIYQNKKITLEKFFKAQPPPHPDLYMKLSEEWNAIFLSKRYIYRLKINAPLRGFRLSTSFTVMKQEIKGKIEDTTTLSEYRILNIYKVIRKLSFNENEIDKALSFLKEELIMDFLRFLSSTFLSLLFKYPFGKESKQEMNARKDDFSFFLKGFKDLLRFLPSVEIRDGDSFSISRYKDLLENPFIHLDSIFDMSISFLESKLREQEHKLKESKRIIQLIKRKRSLSSQKLIKLAKDVSPSSFDERNLRAYSNSLELKKHITQVLGFKIRNRYPSTINEIKEWINTLEKKENRTILKKIILFQLANPDPKFKRLDYTKKIHKKSSYWSSVKAKTLYTQIKPYINKLVILYDPYSSLYQDEIVYLEGLKPPFREKTSNIENSYLLEAEICLFTQRDSVERIEFGLDFPYFEKKRILIGEKKIGLLIDEEQELREHKELSVPS